MAKSLQYPWCIYADLQKSARNRRISSKSWGTEAGLSHILTALETDTVPPDPDMLKQQVARTVDGEAWNERNRARLRLKYPPLIDIEPSPELMLLARHALRRAKEKIGCSDDWALLCSIAAGRSYNEIAATLCLNAGALRTRVARLRATLMH